MFKIRFFFNQNELEIINEHQRANFCDHNTFLIKLIESDIFIKAPEHWAGYINFKKNKLFNPLNGQNLDLIHYFDLVFRRLKNAI